KIQIRTEGSELGHGERFSAVSFPKIISARSDARVKQLPLSGSRFRELTRTWRGRAGADFIQEFGFVLRGLQSKIDPSCIATTLLLPHQRPESQLYAGVAPAVHNGPWPVIAWPLATGLLRIS